MMAAELCVCFAVLWFTGTCTVYLLHQAALKPLVHLYNNVKNKKETKIIYFSFGNVERLSTDISNATGVLHDVTRFQ